MTIFDPGEGWREVSALNSITKRAVAEHHFNMTDMTTTNSDDQEYWAVYGGQGLRRIAQNLPSREAAEKIRRDFNYRLRDYIMPPTKIEKQHGCYTTPLV